jgi:hypothetical protein
MSMRWRAVWSPIMPRPPVMRIKVGLLTVAGARWSRERDYDRGNRGNKGKVFVATASLRVTQPCKLKPAAFAILAAAEAS